MLRNLLPGAMRLLTFEDNTSASALCSAPTGADEGFKSYKYVVSTGHEPKVFDSGFATAKYKDKRISETPSVSNLKPHRQPFIGARTLASLSVVSKRERSMTLFLSRFRSRVRDVEVKKPSKEQLSLQRSVCTILKINLTLTQTLTFL
jgi:hypothetical protein